MATSAFGYALANPISAFLDKPAADFRRADLLKVIAEKGIERITFHYTAGDGKLKELVLPAASPRAAEVILAEGERVDGSSLFKGMVDMGSSDLYVVPVYRTAFLNPFDPGSLDLTKPGLKIVLSDPLEKQALVAGVTDQLRNHKTGFELSYENRCFWPTFFLGLSRDYAFSDSSAGDFYLFEAEKTDDFTAGLSCPVDLFKNPRFSQHVSVSGTFLERQWRDSLYSAGYDVVWESEARREVPLSLGYGFFSYRTFTGNLIHPLDAFAVSAVFTAASRDWGSDVRYRTASLHLRKSAEIGRTFQTVFLRAHLVNQFDRSDTYIRISGGDLPRGRGVLREYRSQRYASLTAEYRLPVVKELRFSLLGVYFGRLAVGPFFDFLAWNEPGVGESRARGDLLSEKTAGIQLRQRLFFLGHSFMDLGFFWAYDENRDEPHVFSFNAGAGF